MLTRKSELCTCYIGIDGGRLRDAAWGYAVDCCANHQHALLRGKTLTDRRGRRWSWNKWKGVWQMERKSNE
jgi:hypothetical protein